MIGQLSIFEFGDKPQKFHEAEWLIGQGYVNVYDKRPPQAGLYEWADIECPTKTKILKVTETGAIEMGRLAMGVFRPCWWRPNKRKSEG